MDASFVVPVAVSVAAVAGSVLLIRKLGVPRKFLVVLLAISLAFIVVRLPVATTPSVPTCNPALTSASQVECIGDENAYIPAAEYIAAGRSCPLTSSQILGANGTSESPCNLEHPPLVKLLMAAGIAMFGDTPAGWRFFPFLIGSVLVPLVFALAYTLSRRSVVATLAAFFTATDMIVLLYSSAGLLDVPAIFFSLAGTTYFIIRWDAKNNAGRKLTDVLVTSALLGLGILAKEVMVLFVVALVAYYLITARVGHERLTPTLATAAALATLPALVFLMGLGLFDHFYVPGFSTPFAHVSYMLHFGYQIRWSSYDWADTVFNTAINPFTWVGLPAAFPINNAFGIQTWAPFSRLYVAFPDIVTMWAVFFIAPFLVHDSRRAKGMMWSKNHTASVYIGLFLLSLVASMAIGIAEILPFVNQTVLLLPGELNLTNEAWWVTQIMSYYLPFVFAALLGIQLVWMAARDNAVRLTVSKHATLLFVMLFFAIAYGGFLVLYVTGRQVLPLYSIELVPVMAIGLGYLLDKRRSFIIPAIMVSASVFAYLYLLAL